MTMTVVRSLLVALALLPWAGPAHAAEIRWYRDLKEASEAAQKANLPMFIDFWADWCAACNIMDAEVYTDARVIRAFEARAIGVRIHYDLQPDVARKYNVPALPYLLFTNSLGTPLVHSRGLLEAEDLAQIIEAMPPLSTINRLDRTLQQKKDDFPSLVAMGRELRAAGFWEASNTYYERALKHRTIRSDASAREWVRYDVALNWLELQDGRKAAAVLQQWLKDFPASARKPDALAALDRARALD
jgi:thioredoxin-like negative regulator of GroEL